jgi:hypothetical protein
MNFLDILVTDSMNLNVVDKFLNKKYKMFSYKLVGWFTLILIILFGLYNECESHEYVEKRSRWTMSSKERYEYKMKRFCALPMWFWVLFALALTISFNVTAYTTYAFYSLLALYAMFMLF